MIPVFVAQLSKAGSAMILKIVWILKSVNRDSDDGKQVFMCLSQDSAESESDFLLLYPRIQERGSDECQAFSQGERVSEWE